MIVGVKILQIPCSISMHLSAKVLEFIIDSHCHIPMFVWKACPGISQLAMQVTLPKSPQQGCLMWKATSNEDLTFKDAYLFKARTGQKIHWAKLAWSQGIPPSKSLFAWRVMHDRVPTDEKLQERGLNISSDCNCCFKEAETTMHLFFLCPFAARL